MFARGNCASRAQNGRCTGTSSIVQSAARKISSRAFDWPSGDFNFSLSFDHAAVTCETEE